MKRLHLIIVPMLISLAALGLSLASPAMLATTTNAATEKSLDKAAAVRPMKYELKSMPSVDPIQSDDFNSCTLSPFWTHTEGIPGDPAPVFSGGAVSLIAPAGEGHDTYFEGQSFANRLTQPAPNTDFEIQVKFDSGLGETWQTQGVLVEQDTNDLLRFEFYGKTISSGGSTETNTYAFAAKIVDGDPIDIDGSGEIIAPGYTAPLYLRVKRVGNQWTHSYSFNETDWTVYQSFSHPLQVSAISVYGGNASLPLGADNAPAHTAIIDYFYNTASPGPGDATLSVNIIGQGSVAKTPDECVYSTGDVVNLEATGDTGWAFTGWSGDISGFKNPRNVIVSGDKVITARFEPKTSHTLTVTPLGEGTVEVDPIKPNNIYQTGDVVTLTAIANPGYKFIGWRGDWSGRTNPVNILINEDLDIIGAFGNDVYMPLMLRDSR